MRFLMVDRIIRLQKGLSIEGIKAFSLSEQYLNGHFYQKPLVPGTIFIESMAQLLGALISFSHDFRYMAMMAQIRDVVIPWDMRPGFSAVIRAELISTTRTDSAGRAEILVDEKTMGSIGRILYTHVRVPSPESLRKHFAYISGF